MALPARFANIEAEPVTVTRPTKVTGPVRLELILSQPTDLGDKRSEITITEEVLNNGVMPLQDVLVTAYNRLVELLGATE